MDGLSTKKLANFIDNFMKSSLFCVPCTEPTYMKLQKFDNFLEFRISIDFFIQN